MTTEGTKDPSAAYVAAATLAARALKERLGATPALSRQTIQAWLRAEASDLSPEALAALTAVCLTALVERGLLDPAQVREEGC